MKLYHLILILAGLLISDQSFAQKETNLTASSQNLLQFEKLVLQSSHLTHEDSVVVAYGQMKGLFRSLTRIRYPIIKCGSALAEEANQILSSSPLLSTSVLLSTEQFSDTLKSPGRQFTIYFSRTGADSVSKEYADSIAKYADEAYTLEVVELGYEKPPFSSSDSTWRIDINHIGPGGYGFTTPIGNPIGTSKSGLKKFLSTITINNNFDSGFATKGLDAARITIFHEFHHVIQNGSYGKDAFSTNDLPFREMMAVWMEMKSSPWITDYLQYLPAYTKNIDFQFDHIPGSGYYGQCIWMEFLAHKYSDEFIKHVWEYYSDTLADFLTSFDKVLVEYQTTFCSEYKRFGTALYYTGKNYQGESYFSGARKFNSENLRRKILLPNNRDTLLQAFDASLHIYACGYGKDTSVIVITRSVDRAFNSDMYVTSRSLLVFQDSFQFPETFCDTISLPSIVKTKVFPQPYVISESSPNSLLNVLASTNNYAPLAVQLNIYTLDNVLIRHIERARASAQILAADPFGGSWYIEWDGRDDIGRLVPSGVYIYSVENDQNRDVGKIVVLRKN